MLRQLEPPDDRRKVSRQHDVVLVEDAHPGRPAEGHALVPVAGQAKTVLVDDQTRAFARQGANQLDGFVVRTIVADQEVERTAVLIQNGVERLGEMSRAVAGGKGDREQGGGASARIERPQFKRESGRQVAGEFPR